MSPPAPVTVDERKIQLKKLAFNPVYVNRARIESQLNIISGSIHIPCGTSRVKETIHKLLEIPSR
jgi:hypothetical protein